MTTNKWPRDRYTGPGGGLYPGPCKTPYANNWPPPHIFIEELRKRGQTQIVKYMINLGFLSYLR